MTEKKRKALYWTFKIISVIISCLLPVLAICEKFPIWEIEYGTQRTASVGGIFILIVLLFIFRKTVFNFMNDRLKLKYAPPIMTPIVMLIISYILEYINNFVRDLTTVCWVWIFGSAIGMVFTFIAENVYGKKDEK